MIYTIGGQKGGGGKTTTAINLAIELSRKGRECLLVDGDPQKSATIFTQLREETQGKAGYTAIELTGINVRKQIPKLAEKYQEIVIDTGGRDSDSQRAALTVSHFLISPFVPGSLDIWTLEDVDKFVSEARVINPDLKAFSFINMGYPRGGDNEAAADILRESQEVEYLETVVVKRKVFASAVAKGVGIFELGPKEINDKACDEFKALMLKVIPLFDTL